MIPQKTTELILETARIEEVVKDFVSLKRRGVNMIGLCPFHTEKTPSFTVSPSKNIFKCFGCGKGGNATTFLMEHESFTFPEALRYLAHKYNIEIKEQVLTPELMAARQEEESLFILNEYARQYYSEQLFNSDVGRSVGLNYFKERGFLEETIRKFGLGFAPNEADAFTSAATAKGFQPAFLKKLGLTTSHNKDFFRNRVIFTIHNLSGKPVAFAGRIMQKDVKAPKYINSPETDSYTKSKTLYGAWFAKKAIQQKDECILVEGYTDVISLHQAGIENVVASSGTSLTREQISLIRRFTPNIKILYDGDPAGLKAALRGMDMVLEQNMNVRLVLLPQGEDPDSYLQKAGVSAFEDYLKNEAKDFILFKTNLLLGETQGDPVKKAGLVHDIVESIGRIPDSFKRAAYIKECARLMEMEERTLMAEVNKIVASALKSRQLEHQRKEGIQVNIVAEGEERNEEKSPAVVQKKSTSAHEFKERDIARLLIAFGQELYDDKQNMTIAEYILSHVRDVVPEFESEQYRLVVQTCLERFESGLYIHPQFFIGHVNKSLSALAVDLLHEPWEYSPGWEARGFSLQNQDMPDKNFVRDTESALARYLLTRLDKMCKQNQERIKKLESAKDDQEVTHLLRVQSKLIRQRMELAMKLGTVIPKG